MHYAICIYKTLKIITLIIIIIFMIFIITIRIIKVVKIIFRYAFNKYKNNYLFLSC